MRHVAGRSVTVDHAARRFANIGQLMEHARRNVDGLSGVQNGALLAQAHLRRSFDEEVDLFLLLVVPGHLPAVRFQRDVAHGKIRRLDRARAAHQVLRAPPRGIHAAGDLREIGNNHEARIARPRSMIEMNGLMRCWRDSARYRLRRIRQDPVFRTAISLVKVDAEVAGKSGVIDGLQKEDFVILDNGQPQTLRYFSQEEEPLDIILLFDISASMGPSIRKVA